MAMNFMIGGFIFTVIAVLPAFADSDITFAAKNSHTFSTRPTPSTKACGRERQLNSAVHQSCIEQEGFDIQDGRDIAKMTQSSKEHCCGLCDAELDCRGWAWNHDEGGTCYLKSASGPMFSNTQIPHTIAGYVVSRQHQYTESQKIYEAEHCKVLANTELEGGDLFKIDYRDETSCCQLCVDHENHGCKAYTWFGDVCYLKRGSVTPTRLFGRRSGMVFSFNRNSSMEPPISPSLHRVCPEQTNLTVQYKQRQELECVVHARPPPNYRWLKDGKDLARTGRDAPRLADSGRRLILPRVAAREDNGRYECVATNPYGQVQHDWILSVQNDPTTGIRAYFSLIIVGLAIIAGLSILSFGVYVALKRRSEQRYLRALERSFKNVNADENAIKANTDLMRQADKIKYDPSYEIPRCKLRVLSSRRHLLGCGAFGRVLLGFLHDNFRNESRSTARYCSETSELQPLSNQQRQVAVKVPKKPNDIGQLAMLLAEFKVYLLVGKHTNILELVGVVIEDLKSRRELSVAFEYCGHGSLKSFLTENRENFFSYTDLDGMLTVTSNSAPSTAKLTTRSLVDFAYHIATGLAYLAEVHIVHRDLAARNVLLGEDYVAKICDFGMARLGEPHTEYNAEHKYKSSKAVSPGTQTSSINASNCLSKMISLPTRWTAPESFPDRQDSSTTCSDVWSFGVVLWEIFTLGEQPYTDVSLRSDTEVNAFVDKLVAGYRLDRPQRAPRSVYLMMQRCWQLERKDRPNVGELQRDIMQVLEEVDQLVCDYNDGMTTVVGDSNRFSDNSYGI